MNDIDVKLNSNNPVFIAQAVSKIVDTIISEHEKKKHETNYRITELQEYKRLEQNCVTANASINLAASRGILQLVQNGAMQWTSMPNNFLLIASNTQYDSFVLYK